MTEEEKTIFIRCTKETNDLLEAIRKAEMPHRSRNSEIIYLIHKEAKALDISLGGNERKVKTEEQLAHEESIFGVDANGSPISEYDRKEEEAKAGLGGLAEKVKRENLR
jgi:hypothetical protein